MGAGITENYIANSTFLTASDFDPNLESDAQITVSENLGGFYNLRAFSTYGFPLRSIKLNLNIDLSGTFSHTPGLINEEENFTDNTSLGLGLTLSSNVSDKVDFTISSRSGTTNATSSLQTASNSTFFSQTSKLKFNWLLPQNIIFRTDVVHSLYQGLEDDFDQNFVLWNMSIGKKLFKDNRGEISISVFDLLDQNNSLSRTITETFTEDSQVNVLQRFFMLNFKYDVRHFRSKKATGRPFNPCLLYTSDAADE